MKEKYWRGVVNLAGIIVFVLGFYGLNRITLPDGSLFFLAMAAAILGWMYLVMLACWEINQRLRQVEDAKNASGLDGSDSD